MAQGSDIAVLNFSPRRQTANKTMNAFDRADLSKEFAAFLPLPASLDPHLEEALRHVLDTPGSLVRPRIVFQMASAYGIASASAKDLAVALEYFHTASLLFDDLPCMDNAVQRRGSPCVHLAFGEAGAILAALALINRAYALSWRAVSECPRERQTRALTYIEQRLGVEGLLDGQSRDLHYATSPHDNETNRRIAYGKTVSLIRLALVLPAMLGGASARELQLLERLSTFWGLSYQIADDLKDLLRSDDESGKTGSRDMLLDRPNAALVLGIPAAVARLKQLIRAGDKTLNRLMALKSALSFLGKLRGDLQNEVKKVNDDVTRVSRDARLMTASGTA